VSTYKRVFISDQLYDVHSVTGCQTHPAMLHTKKNYNSQLC